MTDFEKKAREIVRQWWTDDDGLTGLEITIAAALEQAAEEASANGASWFNAFGNVESWMFQHGWWGADGEQIGPNPDDTLIRACERKEGDYHLAIAQRDLAEKVLQELAQSVYEDSSVPIELEKRVATVIKAIRSREKADDGV